MLWVVMNIVCFVSLLLMVCWNLHMPGVEIYTFIVIVIVFVCWNLCMHMAGIAIYTLHGYLGEFG